MARKKKRRREQNPKRGRRRSVSPNEGSGVIPDTNYSYEEDFDGAWHVRHISSWRAVKTYTCPGCYGLIPQGQPHIVAWRSDWVMGDEQAAQLRRHWHTACWKNRRQDRR